MPTDNVIQSDMDNQSLTGAPLGVRFALRLRHWRKLEEEVSVSGRLKLQILQAIQESSRRRYTALMDALEQQYCDSHFQKYHEIQLRSRQQNIGETFQQLVVDIERLPEVQDSQAAEQFIEDIANPEVKHTLGVSVCRYLR